MSWNMRRTRHHSDSASRLQERNGTRSTNTYSAHFCRRWYAAPASILEILADTTQAILRHISERKQADREKAANQLRHKGLLGPGPIAPQIFTGVLFRLAQVSNYGERDAFQLRCNLVQIMREKRYYNGRLHGSNVRDGWELHETPSTI